ncbi:hypothetical protein [Leifsonia sp. Leaf264]|uniref:hypothetical protein n=1 Tax=Leifsonia sp. Leaf264 TaxID=1736314 RepID=UPI0006F47D27|nr:hypothetical protein [Leifsonia sp. Leaf264]KQO98319.1 hypothetical protein ASF30_09675 [Leifsonia sp. Leaf264]
MKTNDFYSINDQLTALFQQFDVPSSDETDDLLDTLTHHVADAIQVARGEKAPVDPAAVAEAVVAANYADEDDNPRTAEEILQELLDARALDASDILSMIGAAISG